MAASLSSSRGIGNHEMVEEDQQAWNRPGQRQVRGSYTEDDAAIDRAIAATYGGNSGALRDADGNKHPAQKTTQPRAPKSSSGYSGSSMKREKSRGHSVTRGVASKHKADTSKGVTTEKEKWIHRDKLALIEVQEFRELGLEPPQELLRRLAESRAGNRVDDAEALRRVRTPEPDEFEDAQEDFGQQPQAYHHEQQDEQEESEADEAGNDLPQSSPIHEVASQAPQGGGGQSSPPPGPSGMLRKSHSRLPVSSSSITPVNQEAVERESPAARKRGPSSAGEADSFGYPRVRARKSSVGSQVMLDDEPTTPNRSAFPTPPSKASFASLSKQKEKGKGKFNTISGIPKTRSTSTGRPGTAGDGRPRTATNPPEGDPPWLAGMYKPDPRLPPDQQMLPTHAKRLAQEQWERDGKSANTYDRDFKPLTNFDDQSEIAVAEKARSSFGVGENGNDSGRESGRESEQISRQEARESPLKETNPGLGIETPTDADWPLTASRTPSPTKKRANGGGYSTIPRLTDSPKPAVGLFPSPRPGDQPSEIVRPVTRHGPGTQHDGALGLETRVTGGIQDPEKAESEKKRGGCGCCVVM